MFHLNEMLTWWLSGCKPIYLFSNRAIQRSGCGLTILNLVTAIGMELHILLGTVNWEIFAGISFSQKVSKDIFATLTIRK